MKFGIFTGRQFFNIIVEANSELEAKRKFIRYVSNHPNEFSFDSIKLPTLNTTFEGEFIWCINIINNKLYYDDIYLGELNNQCICIS